MWNEILVLPSTHLEQLMRIAVNIAHADSGIVTPIVVPEYRAHEFRDEMEDWLRKATPHGYS